VQSLETTVKKENENITRYSIPLNFADLSNMILKDLNERDTATSKTYTKDQVTNFLTNPRRNSKELVKMSEYLFNASPHYKRVVNYFAKMHMLDYIVEPYGLDTEKVNEKSFKNIYFKTNDLLEQMNLKHEMKKVLQVCWVKDTFYGYEHEGKNSYFIQQLPNDYCAISSIEDGVYNFSFDMAYFDRNTAQLEMYPKEFKKLYNKYKNGSEGQWIELDPQKTICIKVNEEIDYDLPPFVGIFPAIFDIEDYKALKKAKSTIENYKFIVQKIPIRDNSDRNNDFLLDLTTVATFNNLSATTIPSDIGLLTIPFDIETIDFQSDKSERNSVWEAEHDFYTSVGTSALLFNGEDSSQANLRKSIQVDELEAIAIVRQIERWVNRKIKYLIKGAYKFKCKILDVTIFNREEYIDRLLKSAQYGFPVKLMLSSLLGVSPAQTSAMTYLENTILGLVDSFVPLQSSHTQSGKEQAQTEKPKDVTDDGGRPTVADDELTEKGEEQRNRDDNANQE
jgi:hypothetical protein